MVPYFLLHKWASLCKSIPLQTFPGRSGVPCWALWCSDVLVEIRLFWDGKWTAVLKGGTPARAQPRPIAAHATSFLVFALRSVCSHTKRSFFACLPPLSRP